MYLFLYDQFPTYYTLRHLLSIPNGFGKPNINKLALYFHLDSV